MIDESAARDALLAAGQGGVSAGAEVRAMRREDVPAAVALAARVHTAPHWPMFEYVRMLEIAEREPERRAAWVLCAFAAAREAHLLGFALGSHAGGLAELEAIVVDPAHRGQRLGERLVRAAAAWAHGAGAERLGIEVRCSNQAALRLYQRVGFQKDGVRPRYYSNPEEDAVLMSLALEG